MIPVKTNNVNVSSTLDDSKRGKLGIDPDAFDKIKMLLTNVYSDPIAACVREYAVNGWDATVEASEGGADIRPVELSTPTGLRPEFTVRDYGIGLDADSIVRVFVNYGSSTKEGTNSQSGMMGIGSKSALTYTDQFTVVGFKNGIKTVVLITKDENDSPEYMIVSETKTDEPNGVLIKIPVRNGDFNKFAEAAKHLMQFWEPGHGLVDGEEVGMRDWKALDETHWISTTNSNHYNTSVYVVMGKVPYRVPASLLNSNAGSREDKAVFVPMGSVHFPPSREELMETNLTKNTVKSHVNDFEWDKVYAEVISNEIETTCATHYDAMKLAYSYGGRFGLKYKGFVIPGFDWRTNQKDTKDYFTYVRRHSNRGRKKMSSSTSVDVTWFLREPCAIITNIPDGKRTSHLANKFFHHQNFDIVLMSSGDISDIVWLDGAERFDYNDVKSWSAVPRKTAPAKAVPEYDTYSRQPDGSIGVKPLSVIPKGAYYISPAVLRAQNVNQSDISPVEVMNLLGIDNLVMLPRNRVDKFFSLGHTAKRLDGSADFKHKRPKLKFKATQNDFNRHCNSVMLRLATEWRDSLLDPRFRVLLDWFGSVAQNNEDDAARKKAEKEIFAFDRVARRINLKVDAADESESTEILDKAAALSEAIAKDYTMIRSFGWGHIDVNHPDVLLYVNTKFKSLTLPPVDATVGDNTI